jgi:hypothetical protein
MKIAAIDPGLSGAAVVLEQIGGAVMLISMVDLPVMGEGAKRRLDAFTFARWINDHAPTHVVENGRSMPRQGVTSSPLRAGMRRSRRSCRRLSHSDDDGRAGDMEASP